MSIDGEGGNWWGQEEQPMDGCGGSLADGGGAVEIISYSKSKKMRYIVKRVTHVSI